MRNPQGYMTIIAPDAQVERDTITCGHCQRIVTVKPGTAATVYLLPQAHGPDVEEPGAFCRTCMSSICLHCCDAGTCTPFMRRIEEHERLNRRP